MDDDLDEEEAIREIEKKNLENVVEDETLEIDEIVNIKESRNHPLENVIGNLNQQTLRSQAQNQSNFFCFISTIEPKNVNEALGYESWIVAMQEELNQFIANDVWELVPQPKNMKIIGTKWVFRNKLDENGIVSRNKARLVAQGYNQQEGIDYDETYAPVARLESIRILLAYACALDFKLFQMDVKSAFLNGFINEEVYVAQPPGFIDFEKPDHVYKLKKALYGLKQAPKAWWQLQSLNSTRNDFFNISMVSNSFGINSWSNFSTMADYKFHVDSKRGARMVPFVSKDRVPETWTEASNKVHVSVSNAQYAKFVVAEPYTRHHTTDLQKRLLSIYDKVLIVDNISMAEEVLDDSCLAQVYKYGSGIKNLSWLHTLNSKVSSLPAVVER
ncbi:retrovirus-related pol polyprotein from transposon TNT 1-94 [Tanacetum coccineum]